MPIKYPQRMLEMCGISQPEIEEQIHILEKYLGEPLIEALFKKYNGLSVVMINQICERSVLLEVLATIPGFNKVLKSIADKNALSLDEPHGEWFQLTVGYLLISINEHPIFEQKIDGAPKDILIREDNIHIECKSFRGSEATSKALTKLFRSGEAPKVEANNSDGFTLLYRVITSFPSWPRNPAYNINEFQRFFENGIVEKHKQLLNGKCNLIALNGDLFISDLQRFRNTVSSLLLSYPRISGLLIVYKEHKLTDIPYKLLGSAYGFELIINEKATVSVPPDLQYTLTPQVRKIALRP